MRLHDLDRLLTGLGWHLARRRGAHWHYKDSRGRRLTFSAHGRAVSVETVDNIWHDLRRMEQQHNTGGA